MYQCISRPFILISVFELPSVGTRPLFELVKPYNSSIYKRQGSK